MNLSEIDHEWKRNPRTISPEAKEGLRASLERYGPLGDITFNRRNENLVCGHQRMRQLKELLDGSDPEIEMVDDNWGFFLVGDERHPVRFVDVDDETHSAMAILANSPTTQGDFDVAGTAALLKELENMDDEFRFDEFRFDELADELGIRTDEQSVELRKLDVSNKPPPKMAWCLIGLPLVRWWEVDETIRTLGEDIEGIIIETTVATE